MLNKYSKNNTTKKALKNFLKGFLAFYLKKGIDYT